MQIDFPIRFDSFGGTAGTSPADHARDMIELLLLTGPGERVNRPDFGSGLMQMVFAPNSPEIAAAIQFTVQAALDRWLGDVIDVHRLTVVADEDSLSVSVDYVLRETGVSQTTEIRRSVSGMAGAGP